MNQKFSVKFSIMCALLSILLHSSLVDSVSLFPSKIPSSVVNRVITSPSISSSSSSSSTSTDSFPWKQSIQPTRQLSYMPMLQAQLDTMKELQMESVSIDNKFVYQHSTVKEARIASLSFKNSIFRSVRLTYFDAGDNVQVFNSLWCPDYQYDIPMLGIDLISLGKSRVLSVIDFQPLVPTEEYSEKYITPLNSIREKYPSLQGTLSGKIYDDTSFFSKNMLFGRFTDETKLMTDVLPAFQEYLQQYMLLAQSAVPNHSAANIAHVMERQKAYEVYSAAKDPAVGLFDAYFGKQWSSDFVHEYLFPLSSRSDVTYAAPVHNFQPPSATVVVPGSFRPPE